MDEQELFDLVRNNYIKANQDYIVEQIRIASEYMTDKQKEELRSKWINVKRRIKMIMLKKLFRRKKDLRELCRERYGDDFVMKYDTINSGGTIGGLSETIAFIEMVEEVKRTSDWK